MSMNKVFIAHSGSGNDGFGDALNGMLCDINGTDIIIPSTIKEAESKIDGIAKTECTTSTPGDVYVLNTTPVVSE